MDKPSLADRLRYRFDNFMARGTIALIAGLGAITLVITIAAAAVVTFTGLGRAAGWRFGFGEAGFQSLIRELDSGAFGVDTGWGLRIVMLLVTIGGIFILGARDAERAYGVVVKAAKSAPVMTPVRWPFNDSTVPIAGMYVSA